jgi:hypothetical protein
MSALQGILASPKVNRYLPWVSGLILLAGVIAFLIAYFGNTAPKDNASKVSNEPAAREQSIGKPIPFRQEARRVAARFIEVGVKRTDATATWKLIGPNLRSGYTSLAQWKRDWNDPNEGVPIVPYPAAPHASLSLDYAREKEIQVKFFLRPRAGADEEPQTFLMVLDRIGGRWVVNDWQSYSPPSPVTP